MAWTTPSSGDEFWDLTEDWVAALTEIRTAIRDREDIQSRSHGTLTLPSSGAQIRTVTRNFILAARADIEGMLEEAGDSSHEFNWTNSSWIPTVVPTWGAFNVLRSGASSVTLITELQDILDDMKYYEVVYELLPSLCSFPSGSSHRTSFEKGVDEGFNAANQEGIWDDTKTGTPGVDGGGENTDATSSVWTTAGAAGFAVAWALGDGAGTPWMLGDLGGGVIRGPKVEIDIDTADLDGVLTTGIISVGRDNKELSGTVGFKMTATAGDTVTDTWNDGTSSEVITYNAAHDPDLLGTVLTLTLEITTAEPADHPFNAFPFPPNDSLDWGQVHADAAQRSGFDLQIRANATSVLTN